MIIHGGAPLEATYGHVIKPSLDSSTYFQFTATVASLCLQHRNAPSQKQRCGVQIHHMWLDTISRILPSHDDEVDYL